MGLSAAGGCGLRRLDFRRCDICSLEVSLPQAMGAGDLLGAWFAHTCPGVSRRRGMERGWGQRVGWAVTTFLRDLSLPTGTLGFSPGGPKRFEPSQSSTQSKVFCRAHLRRSGWEAGSSRHVCAQWDGASWALAESGTGQRLLLFLVQAGSKFASLFSLCVVCPGLALTAGCRIPRAMGCCFVLSCPLWECCPALAWQ